MNISSSDTRDNYKSLQVLKVLELRAPGKWTNLLKEVPLTKDSGQFHTHTWSLLCVMQLRSYSPEWAPAKISLSNMPGSSPSSNWQITYGLDTRSPDGKEKIVSAYVTGQGCGPWS